MGEMYTMSMDCPECGGYGVIQVDWEDHVPYHSCYRCGESGRVAAYSLMPYSSPAWLLADYIGYMGWSHLLDEYGRLKDLSSHDRLMAEAAGWRLSRLSDRFRSMGREILEWMESPAWDGCDPLFFPFSGEDFSEVPF